MTAHTLIGKKPIRRALISVYDKSGLIALAQGLHHAGVEAAAAAHSAFKRPLECPTRAGLPADAGPMPATMA